MLHARSLAAVLADWTAAVERARRAYANDLLAASGRCTVCGRRHNHPKSRRCDKCVRAKLKETA